MTNKIEIDLWTGDDGFGAVLRIKDRESLFLTDKEIKKIEKEYKLLCKKYKEHIDLHIERRKARTIFKGLKIRTD